MSYSALVLLPAHQDASLEQIEQLMRVFFEQSNNPKNQKARIIRHNDSVEYQRNTWNAYITLVNHHRISTENPNIAQQIQQKHPDITGNMVYIAKIEVTTSKDRHMEYFNDYVLILERLEHIPDALLYDEYSGEIL